MSVAFWNLFQGDTNLLTASGDQTVSTHMLNLGLTVHQSSFSIN